MFAVAKMMKLKEKGESHRNKCRVPCIYTLWLFQTLLNKTGLYFNSFNAISFELSTNSQPWNENRNIQKLLPTSLHAMMG